MDSKLHQKVEFDQRSCKDGNAMKNKLHQKADVYQNDRVSKNIVENNKFPEIIIN